MNISYYDINTEFILNFCFNNEQACSTTAALFWHFWEAHLLLKWKNIGKQEIHQRCSLWYNKSIHFWVFCWNTRPLNKPNWHEKEKTELQSKCSFSSKSLVKKKRQFLDDGGGREWKKFINSHRLQLPASGWHKLHRKLPCYISLCIC